MIAKTVGMEHFTKRFGEDGTVSDRVILPDPDGCRVKLTRFRAKAGKEFKDVAYPTDETVYVIEGFIEISNGADLKQIGQGGSYHFAAGEKYNFRALWDSLLICFFSPGADGILPDNE